MKINKSAILVFLLLLVSAALYRIIPSRPAGFAPQMAMALFGGAIIKDKKWAFILPLLSLFISDLLYQILYINNIGNTPGFYEGQWAIYLVFVLLTLFGTMMKKISFVNITVFSLAGSVIFFLLSNFITWKIGFGFARPQTAEGLIMCYNDAIAYYRHGGIIYGFDGNFVLGDLIWSFILFGSYFLVSKFMTVSRPQPANL